MFAVFKNNSGALLVRPVNAKGRPVPAMPGDEALKIIGVAFRSKARAGIELRRLEAASLAEALQ